VQDLDTAPGSVFDTLQMKENDKCDQHKGAHRPEMPSRREVLMAEVGLVAA